MTIDARKKRFLKNVVDNPSHGQGELWRSNYYKYPTTHQMDQFKKYNIIYDIDPALRKVIIELNSRGYRTGGSCQGHLKANKYGYIKINTSWNQLPARFRHQNTSLARALSRDLSPKDIDPDDIKSILKKHNIIVTRYETPYYPKDEIHGKFNNQYVFIFPIIPDKYPRETITYYYIVNGNLETSNNPKTNSVKLIQLRDANGNYTGFKLIKNGKLMWKKDLTTRSMGATLSTVNEIQKEAYKALGSTFDPKKFKEEIHRLKHYKK